MKKTDSYTASFEEIQKILAALEQGDVDVDVLSDNVKRAAELIEFCRKRLRETELQVKKVMEKFDEDGEDAEEK
ncbi:MAG TPA: exodeoxyribonuclease VII small subunit [Elusimicrobiota bacterium]|jgi:exodeoxyribonuclease VII small subunit|nr:exodeoxyribonuclease VII small subunit [Elusimicrobiota bacterium]HND65040.1 exodeoxyribonuclease VII small subunit [Elusimicrobiota bacterium]